MSFANTKFIGSVEDEWRLFSDCPEEYTIGDPIGFGASSTVHSATFRASNEPNEVPCALKVLDLDSLKPRSLHLLQRETTLMSLSKHPNVLRVRGSWIAGHKLFIALRLMNKGSAADVMRYGWPGGMEEEVVRCILAQALKGMNYLHINGFIHRDIKAANLLIDDDGTVLLGDLGVAANLAEDTSHVNPHPTSHPKFSSKGSAGKRSVPIRPRIFKRNSFVGTPCWMAPELIQGKRYDSKADIWSFGITAIELTQGRPPRSRESPQQVLLRIIEEDGPTLDRDGGAYKYSRAFKDIVDWCLNKDPAKRPSAEELLQTPFFKGAKKKSYLINSILNDLPPLARRQERRPIQGVTSATSVDSWDFATTVQSSLTAYQRHLSAEEEEFTISGIFAFDEDESGIWKADAEQPDLEAEVVALPSTSPDSSVRDSDLDDTPSTTANTSTPSSFMEASEMSCTQSANPLPSEASHSANPLSSIAEHTNQIPTSVSHEPPKTRKSISVTRRSSSADGRQNLWQRLKTNVRRSSSFNNVSISRR